MPTFCSTTGDLGTKAPGHPDWLTDVLLRDSIVPLKEPFHSDDGLVLVFVLESLDADISQVSRGSCRKRLHQNEERCDSFFQMTFRC